MNFHEKILCGAICGVLFGCALGLQNFPYSHAPSQDHLFAFLLSLGVFGVVGAIIVLMANLGEGT